MNPRINRRDFLRGAGGALLSLPWFESLGKLAPAKMPKSRLAYFYVPIGVVRRSFFPGEAEATVPKGNQGNKMASLFIPSIKTGFHDLNLTPTLEPLAPVKDKITLITGLDRPFQHGTDVHAQCASCFLSSATPYSVETSAYPLDRTLDHIIADNVVSETPFRTLEFSCNSHKDNKESMYFDNMSWYGTGHVAPSIRDPRKMYNRLFGAQEIQNFRNITDLVLEDARTLNRNLGYNDQQKFAEYFDSIRTIEEQIDKLDRMKGELDKTPMPEPTGAYLPRGEYIRLMGDLMVVALQTGLTRVATFMVGPERWDTPFTYDSLFDKPMSHHYMSHNQTEHVEDLERLDRFHMEQYLYLVQKMDGIIEPDGSSLLDNTIFTYGSGLGDGSTHQYHDLPIVVAGSGRGALKTGQHYHSPEATPLANLWLTQANAMGLNIDRFADSSGTLSALQI
jgi:hypothetical protein